MERATISVEGSPADEARSERACHLSSTSQTSQRGHTTSRHAVWGRHIGQVTDVMSEAKSPRSASRYIGECRMCYQLLALWFGSDKIGFSSVCESGAISKSERYHISGRISCQQKNGTYFLIARYIQCKIYII
jgi:hypothetical protein